MGTVVKPGFYDGAFRKAGQYASDDAIAASMEAKGPGRSGLIREAIQSLGPDGFTADGKPKTDAIEAEMPEGSDRVTAAERDAIWAAVQEKGAT